MSKKKILMLTYNIINKGTYHRAFHLAKILENNGYDIDIITTSKENKFKIKEYYFNQVKIIEMPDLLNGSLRSGWDIWNTCRRLLWLLDKKYDLIHTFDSRPTVLVPSIFLHKIKDIPLIMDWADWFGKGGSIEQRTNKYIKFFLRPIETFFEEIYRTSVDFNTIICNPLIDRALKLGVKKHKIILLPNGCDTKFIKKIDKRMARKAFGFSDQHMIIGHVGTIFNDDARFAVNAFDKLHKLNPNIVLLLIGYCPFDLRSLSEFPDAIFVENNIMDDDIGSLLSCCDVGWLPLNNSTANIGRLPLKLFDFISAGLPIVSTNVGDVSFYIENYQIGITTDVDVLKFVDNTYNLLLNPQLQNLLSNNELRIAENELNWREVGKKLIPIYNSQILKANE